MKQRPLRQRRVVTADRTRLAEADLLLQDDLALMKVHPPDDQARRACKIEHHARQRKFQIVLVANVDQGGDPIDEIGRADVS